MASTNLTTNVAEDAKKEDSLLLGLQIGTTIVGISFGGYSKN